MIRSRFSLSSYACFLLASFLALTAATAGYAQDATITGTVISSSRNTITLSTGAGQFQLFTFGAGVARPSALANGAQVRIVSSPGNDPGVRVIRQIVVVQATSPAQTTPPGQAATQDTVPDVFRRLETDIEREARKYQVAFRGGVALDPELILIGVQGQVGPLFRSGISFRPVLDFGIGEVTAMFSLNGDVIYRLPFSSAQDRWSSYFGAGLGVNLLHQDFTEEEDGRRIDFGDFHSDTALNIIGGIRRRGGMFLEMKTSVYAGPSPTLRMVVGYTF